MREPIVLAWSGGKDSALALRQLRRSAAFEVIALLTTVTAEHDRISMHGVRRTLLEAQAHATGAPLSVVTIPAAASNESYAAAMIRALHPFRQRGVKAIAFGDLFLHDVRSYREDLVSRAGMRAEFPLWGRDTDELAREFIDTGHEAVLTCVDTHALDPAFAGRAYDHRLLEDLPPSVDPCGERGEFHTFVTASPEFAAPMHVRPGDRVLRDGRFMYCELLGSSE